MKRKRFHFIFHFVSSQQWVVPFRWKRSSQRCTTDNSRRLTLTLGDISRMWREGFDVQSKVAKRTDSHREIRSTTLSLDAAETLESSDRFLTFFYTDTFSSRVFICISDAHWTQSATTLLRILLCSMMIHAARSHTPNVEEDTSGGCLWIFVQVVCRFSSGSSGLVRGLSSIFSEHAASRLPNFTNRR